ncbi:GDP-mannose transporter GONST4 [Pyrus ussuriensis x Pyrus communis]|uniref:GDP-mannose transporter GONST4 n=1 Tax=Pyrus ussuriensis x Pyrus communis TaxID=2448454 RepID=A0A5N5GVQ1_9ROSA|nr:GDP-mannose transporter GONST4 [Pyrus ussuriensis x Pyrus communis]
MSAIRVDSAKPYFATSSLVIGYALCSSLLASGFLHHDPFTWQTAKKFLPAALVFYLAIFTNANLLRHNVDTFIVFRSCTACTPLLVALADTAFRKQPIPSKLTFVSLLIILGGAVGYVATDSGFSLSAYSWVFAYLVTITTKMAYIKHMVTNVGLNAWGFVLYNNNLSQMMALPFWIISGECSDVFAASGSNAANFFVN